MTGLLVLTAAAALLYENDFSTRTSAEPLGAAWSVYTYDKAARWPTITLSRTPIRPTALPNRMRGRIRGQGDNRTAG